MTKPRDTLVKSKWIGSTKTFIAGMGLFIIVVVPNLLVDCLKNMNNGPEKQIHIVAEADKLWNMPIDVSMQRSLPERHFGGGRTYTQLLYSDATVETVTKEFYKAAQAKGWTSNGDNTFVKDKMTMSFRILPQAEYAHIKHMQGKTAWKVVIHID